MEKIIDSTIDDNGCATLKDRLDRSYWLSTAIAIIADGIAEDNLSTIYHEYARDEGAYMIQALEEALSNEIGVISEFLFGYEDELEERAKKGA